MTQKINSNTVTARPSAKHQNREQFYCLNTNAKIVALWLITALLKSLLAAEILSSLILSIQDSDNDNDNGNGNDFGNDNGNGNHNDNGNGNGNDIY